ncbi:MAG: ferrous iron transport protein B [Crocinitomicaceae bacterium]|nr:MAG: ferrous iron transport protein B [Crocinitomicaceae bacterium]
MSFQKIALIGNPNTGKTSVFNRLTGLNQHVGNFPGVTVDKKIGKLKSENGSIEIIDLPGTYSIYPHSNDEKVVFDVLNNATHPDHPEALLVVIDASNLERNLLLFTQVYDLNIPVMLILNMSDVAYRAGREFNHEAFQKRFPGVPVIETNARVGLGIDKIIATIKNGFTITDFRPVIENYTLKLAIDPTSQSEETAERYKAIQALIPAIVNFKTSANKKIKVNRLDRILVHPIWGYLIFTVMLLLLFQLIFSIASYPMDLIDAVFSKLSDWFTDILPAGIFTDLISQGIIPGLGGVVIFIPQIALLFLFLGILEETGYMARVVFIMDKLMRPFGLNGKSVVPLLSSAACAIPGIMATRTISSWKERLITIMVAPLMSCSARIPVYTLLIGLVIPQQTVLGFFNLQGLVLFSLYALGLVSALLVSLVMKWIIQSKETSVLMLELPEFKAPRWGNVFINLLEKIKVFVFDAGKVILAVSIILWAMASFGPGDRIEMAVQQIEKPNTTNADSLAIYEQQISSIKLENSYMGIIGKTIEPVIKPIGYDWKIGISLLTSFAAREVFVGSMATIYSVHDDGDTNLGLLEKMRNEKWSDGKPVYSTATGISLMVFYVYAMQCMATLAIVKRETKSWKWPIIQVLYMGALAYLASFTVFHLFS